MFDLQLKIKGKWVSVIWDEGYPTCDFKTIEEAQEWADLVYPTEDLDGVLGRLFPKVSPDDIRIIPCDGAKTMCGVNLNDIEMTYEEMEELTKNTGPLGKWNGAKVLKKLLEVQHENAELLARCDKYEERIIVESETAYEYGYNRGYREGV